MSSPSRLIQTLQAAPDAHPSNLTLLSATQTSLRLDWKVLKHTHMHTYLCLTFIFTLSQVVTIWLMGIVAVFLVSSCVWICLCAHARALAVSNTEQVEWPDSL